MKPTQEQLSTIAAPIVAAGNHDPHEAVRIAHDVWKEAGDYLMPMGAVEENAEAWMTPVQ